MRVRLQHVAHGAVPPIIPGVFCFLSRHDTVCLDKLGLHTLHRTATLLLSVQTYMVRALIGSNHRDRVLGVLAIHFIDKNRGKNAVEIVGQAKHQCGQLQLGVCHDQVQHQCKTCQHVTSCPWGNARYLLENCLL